MKTFRFLSFLFLVLTSISSFAQSKNKIGDFYTFEDGTKGIVFYVNAEGHGLALSLEEDKLRWENETHFVYCQDIVNITNEEYPDVNINLGLGKYNTSFIIAQLGEAKAPAAKYCREQGEEWYLPTVGELYQLFNVANKHGKINRILIDNGYEPLDGWYWTSSEHDNGEAWRIGLNGKIKKCSKLALRVHVRAVRAF